MKSKVVEAEAQSSTFKTEKVELNRKVSHLSETNQELELKTTKLSDELKGKTEEVEKLTEENITLKEKIGQYDQVLKKVSGAAEELKRIANQSATQKAKKTN